MYGVLVARFRRHISSAPPLEEDIDPSSLLLDPCASARLPLRIFVAVLGVRKSPCCKDGVVMQCCR